MAEKWATPNDHVQKARARLLKEWAILVSAYRIWAAEDRRVGGEPQSLSDFVRDGLEDYEAGRSRDGR